MAYQITIKYTDKEPITEQKVKQICAVFEPIGSYVDTGVYTQGLEDKYGKSVYATNVWGIQDLTDPSKVTIPIDGIGNVPIKDISKDGEISFTVDSYKDALHFMDLSGQLKDQGFDITVIEAGGSGDAGDGGSKQE